MWINIFKIFKLLRRCSGIRGESTVYCSALSLIYKHTVELSDKSLLHKSEMINNWSISACLPLERYYHDQKDGLTCAEFKLDKSMKAIKYHPFKIQGQ